MNKEVMDRVIDALKTAATSGPQNMTFRHKVIYTNQALPNNYLEVHDILEHPQTNQWSKTRISNDYNYFCNSIYTEAKYPYSYYDPDPLLKEMYLEDKEIKKEVKKLFIDLKCKMSEHGPHFEAMLKCNVISKAGLTHVIY